MQIVNFKESTAIPLLYAQTLTMAITDIKDNFETDSERIPRRLAAG
jgi:hypothetical protein